jgi:hypothetical protein
VNTIAPGVLRITECPTPETARTTHRIESTEKCAAQLARYLTLGLVNRHDPRVCDPIAPNAICGSRNQAVRIRGRSTQPINERCVVRAVHVHRLTVSDLVGPIRQDNQGGRPRFHLLYPGVSIPRQGRSRAGAVDAECIEYEPRRFPLYDHAKQLRLIHEGVQRQERVPFAFQDQTGKPRRT